jgi:hypothetical protein
METEALKAEIRKKDLLGAIEEGVLYLNENLELWRYSDSLKNYRSGTQTGNLSSVSLKKFLKISSTIQPNSSV